MKTLDIKGDTEILKCTFQRELQAFTVTLGKINHKKANTVYNQYFTYFSNTYYTENKNGT